MYLLTLFNTDSQSQGPAGMHVTGNPETFQYGIQFEKGYLPLKVVLQ